MFRRREGFEPAISSQYKAKQSVLSLAGKASICLACIDVWSWFGVHFVYNADPRNAKKHLRDFHDQHEFSTALVKSFDHVFVRSCEDLGWATSVGGGAH